MGQPVYSTFSTWVTPTVQLQRGEIWDSDDPVVTSHPDWFTDDPEAHGLLRRSGPAPVTEAATADPGEKRNLGPAGGSTGDRPPRTTSRKGPETRG
jgi:hypothetical protein